MTKNPNTHLLSNALKLLLDISAVYNTHWSNISKLIPDAYFDWVIDDVPYGLNVGKMPFLKANVQVKQKNGKKLNPNKNKKYSLKEWDLQTPGQDYFDEMKRISKHQIIFGVEYVDCIGFCKLSACIIPDHNKLIS